MFLRNYYCGVNYETALESRFDNKRDTTDFSYVFLVNKSRYEILNIIGISMDKVIITYSSSDGHTKKICL